MITIGDTVLDLSDPFVMAAIGAGILVLVALILLVMSVRRAGQTAQATTLMIQQVGRLAQDVSTLNEGQHTLAGNIRTVSDQQATAQTQVIQTMESQLAA